jgi:hypothetical protein
MGVILDPPAGAPPSLYEPDDELYHEDFGLGFELGIGLGFSFGIGLGFGFGLSLGIGL